MMKKPRFILMIYLLLNPCMEWYTSHDTVVGAAADMSTDIADTNEVSTNIAQKDQGYKNTTDRSYIWQVDNETDIGNSAISTDQTQQSAVFPVDSSNATNEGNNTTVNSIKEDGDEENYYYSWYSNFPSGYYYFYDSNFDLTNSINETLRNETDQTLKELLQMQMHACPYTDLCRYSKVQEPTYQKPSCKNCSCYKTCGLYGTCCLDSPYANVKPTFLNGTCVSAQFFPDNVVQGDSYYMITECPVSETNETLIYLCGQAELGLLDSVPVVTTSDRPITFKNKYCAECHEETSYEKFNLQFQCKGDFIYNRYQLDGMTNELMRKRDRCNALYLSPELDPYNRCYPDVISKCNITGNWEQYDELIENACHKYTMIYQYGSIQYKNIFCHVCNGGSIDYSGSIYQWVSEDFASGGEGDDLFTLLVDTDTIQDDLTPYAALDKCTRHEIYDFIKDTCRPVRCSDMLYYDKDKCIPAMDGTKRTHHVTFQHEVVFDTDSYPFDFTVDLMTLNYEQYIHNNIRDFSMCFAYVFSLNYIPPYTYSSSYRKYKKYYIYIQFQLESWDSDYVDFLRTMIKMGSIKHEIPGIQIKGHILNSQLKMLNYVYYDHVHFISNVAYTRMSGPEEPCPTWSIQITSLSLCPQVEVNSSEYSFQIINDTVCFVDFCLGTTEFINSSDTTITVCLNTFISLMKMIKDPLQTYKHQILSTLSRVISLSCLGITLVTYLLFKELRTLSGCNNIFLTFSATLSHLALCFDAFLKFDNNLHCLTAGIAVHFIWLHFVALLNTCCVHGFITFVRLSRCYSSTYHAWCFIFYQVWSLVYPVIFISINILTQKSAAEMTPDYVFYEAVELCFVSTFSMLLLTFALPICVPILANVLMLLTIVITILRKSDIWNNLKDEYQNMKVFCGLSSLTVIVWTFAILSLRTNNVVCVYMFNLFVVLHGVGFLLAFVFNRRIWNLYKLLLLGGDGIFGTKPETVGHNDSLTDENKEKRCIDDVRYR